MGTLGENDAYDFNYQIFEPSPEHTVVRRGDKLITNCQYDSSELTAPTLGGDASDEEMCLNFLAYYPKSPSAAKSPGLAWCLSDVESQEGRLTVRGVGASFPVTLATKGRL